MGVSFFTSTYISVVKAFKSANAQRINAKKSRLNALSDFSKWKLSLLDIYDLDELVKYDSPWWSNKSIREVEKWLTTKKNCSVFEWGSGCSTLWLSKRVDSIISIEHDESWATNLSKMLPQNVDLRTVYFEDSDEISELNNEYASSKNGYQNKSFEKYVNSIKDEETFDLIVIDGRARVGCLQQATHHLSPEGIIIFDNSNRNRYKKSLQRISRDFHVKHYFGITMASPIPTRTSILSRKI